MEDYKDALIKKALGYDVDEVVEEYTTDKDGNSILSKRKVTKKHNPPDLAALKVLMEQEGFSDSIEKMTDSELENEKQRLLQLLKEKEKEKDENGSL